MGDSGTARSTPMTVVGGRDLEWRMPARLGVTLVEVLVATVLLAIGVSGSLSALSAAARLRDGARVREALAAAAHDRLSWFEATGCAAGDSSGVDEGARGVQLTWNVRADSTGRAFDIAAEGAWGARQQELRVTTMVSCAADGGLF